jgi:hypothetical protein
VVVLFGLAQEETSPQQVVLECPAVDKPERAVDKPERAVDKPERAVDKPERAEGWSRPAKAAVRR